MTSFNSRPNEPSLAGQTEIVLNREENALRYMKLRELVKNLKVFVYRSSRCKKHNVRNCCAEAHVDFFFKLKVLDFLGPHEEAPKSNCRGYLLVV